ncbi:recombinational DNA repair protein RecT (prophage associated) [Jeotgalibacillus alimentarius]|uniref:Recombinational DNA repair protein RecT (Prophage associated) n=1 Tax=Jeotgalibacillus alimentarius TaxID=135826 RepID=A0A0C2RYU2_9BACL|nr:RecT family recombinase [Jeotgalibacillus alimentarius]KIL46974.1 recombinational DNA repair protein RecT (prophage associated) [Jeotgalibacillus alimentarius]
MSNQVQQGQNNTPAESNKKNEIVTRVAEKVQQMVEDNQINIPENYSIVNAIQAAYFKLTEIDFKKKTSLMDSATKESVAFSLQDMAIQALSVAKNQGYFIVYGDKMQFVRSYHGTQAVIKRMSGVKDLWANVIWKGEEFEVEYNERGQLAFKSHKVDWKAATGSKDDIEGAYCIIERDDGVQFLTVMTMDEIKTSWSQSNMTTVQNKYPQEMAKRTVINRAAKAFINTSDDSDLLIGAVNRTTENEFDNERKELNPEYEVQEKANKESIDFEEEKPKVRKEVIDYEEKELEKEPVAAGADSDPF